MSTATLPVTTFGDLGLAPVLTNTLAQLGYATPSPIQAEAIPAVLAGNDVLGQAQTGTGKTAAFALPLLSRLKPGAQGVQVLVLAPTRELAGQVAESIERYGAGLPGLNVATVYGGAGFRDQLQALRRGPSVVVGTPGRIMDHLRRGTLKLDQLQALVLDEADEMLRMGFIDDVEWILTQTPATRQVVLFSATMPDVIRQIARRHLKAPVEVAIASKTSTATTVRHRYWLVSGLSKPEALMRMLDVEPVDGAIVFVRTKLVTQSLADQLSARGFACAALNGDLPQAQREQAVEQLKRGQLDILVATDVAARGLDVERISHVFNYDLPFDSEAYVHRIGRTGRAGRSGETIAFITPRDRRLLQNIERDTGQRMERMSLPSAADVNAARIQRFKAQINTLLDSSVNLELYERILGELLAERADESPLRLAAVLAHLWQGGQALPMETRDPVERAERADRQERSGARVERGARGERGERPPRERREGSKRERRNAAAAEAGMSRYRVAVGHLHGVRPGNLVGAIANETGLSSRHIGHIDIREDHSLVDLPADMPSDVQRLLQKVFVCGQALQIKAA